MFAIAPTDMNWFNFLKEHDYNSFLNFWTPTPWNIKGLNNGSKLYFLLKSPVRKIAGYGEFQDYLNLSTHDAWVKFGQRNGCNNKGELISKVQTYLSKNSRKYSDDVVTVDNHIIGCIILKNCQFWDEENFIVPKEYDIDFANQIVKLKYFDKYDPFYLEQTEYTNYQILNEPKEEYRQTVNARKGQSTFKSNILKAYNNKCCISGETCQELLEAAHIQQYVNSNSHHIQNGLLLRIDLHKLFDCGLLRIDANYRVVISSELSNSSYSQFNGIVIQLPDNPNHYPSKASLELRIKNFRG